MDEDALQEALSQYKQQLNQIEAVLQVNSNDSQDLDDLVTIKRDLIELIETTEESLLCLKKSKLLQFLNEVDEESNKSEITDNENCDGTNVDCEINATKLDTPCTSLSRTKEIEDAITGTQCRAPYTFDWGVKGYYNAMVLNVEEIDEESEDLKVRVLFINPAHRSMVPCPYFLDGKCRFDDDQCRYSHGCVVNISDLKAYEDPDFSSLKVDDKCLAKYEDGVWYKATILSMTNDKVNIHYDTYNVDGWVSLEDVLPISEMNESDSSDSDSQSNQCAEEDDNDVEDRVIAEFCSSVVDKCGILGEWEKHTKGIASKLMAKMGYVVGNGLGKNGDGRVEPVEIILLPTGKSLDACAELREKKKLKEPFKRKKRKSKQNSNVAGQVPVQNIFEFINNKLGGRKGDLRDLKAKEQFKALDRRKPEKQKSERYYNIELSKLELEKTSILKQINKQKDSVSRNSGRDPAMVQQAKLKMNSMQQHLRQLEDKEKLIKQKIHQDNEHKKLTVF